MAQRQRVLTQGLPAWNSDADVEPNRSHRCFVAQTRANGNVRVAEAQTSYVAADIGRIHKSHQPEGVEPGVTQLERGFPLGEATEWARASRVGQSGLGVGIALRGHGRR